MSVWSVVLSAAPNLNKVRLFELNNIINIAVLP